MGNVRTSAIGSTTFITHSIFVQALHQVSWRFIVFIILVASQRAPSADNISVDGAPLSRRPSVKRFRGRGDFGGYQDRGVVGFDRQGRWISRQRDRQIKGDWLPWTAFAFGKDDSDIYRRGIQLVEWKVRVQKQDTPCWGSRGIPHVPTRTSSENVCFA